MHLIVELQTMRLGYPPLRSNAKRGRGTVRSSRSERSMVEGAPALRHPMPSHDPQNAPSTMLRMVPLPLPRFAGEESAASTRITVHRA